MKTGENEGELIKRCEKTESERRAGGVEKNVENEGKRKNLSTAAFAPAKSEKFRPPLRIGFTAAKCEKFRPPFQRRRVTRAAPLDALRRARNPQNGVSF